MKFKKIFILLIILTFIFNLSVSFADSEFKPEPPEISAGAAILIDSSTEKVLYSKNENEKMYPASTTKIMTAILTIENCKLDEVVTVPYEAVASIPSGYAIAALQPGEQLTVEQVLKVLLVHSANDAANVLAYHVSGSINAFAGLMNSKVDELGLKNTHFLNPSGMHNENHYTTAYDLAILMKYCMKNNTFRSLAGLKYCNIPATNKYEERVFNTTNELLTKTNSSNYYYQYAIAGKTGYTTEAKNCLVSVANKNDLELICVVLSVGMYPNNLSGKFIDSKTLFEFGYNNYTTRKIRDKNAIVTQVDIANGTKETKSLDLLISDDVTALIPQKDLDTEFEPEIQYSDMLLAPISQGQILGKVVYNIDGIEYSSNLVASHSVEKSGFSKITIQIFMIIIILFLLYKLLFGDKKNKKIKKKNKKRKYIEY